MLGMIHIYTMCSHRGEDSQGIFLQNIYTSCVVTGVSSFTRTIPFRNIHTPCVVMRARIPRVYSYMECISAVCSQTGEFHHQDYFFREYIYTPCVVTGVRTRRVYSYTEYIHVRRV